jgi:membrane-associated phospholipid phosphatase
MPLSRTSFHLTLALTVLFGLVFAIWPQIDLSEARRFFVMGRFAGSGSTARGLRWILYLLPTLSLAGAALLWLRGRLAGRKLLFLVLSMALGPGLLVNVGLKDHWHRPRPVQTVDFGGSYAFRPWYRPDGGCIRNCSFVSGEASAAAWLMAPASLTPPQVRPIAMGAALAIAAISGQTRMAFGGHYLSDVVFAILLTLLVCQDLHRRLLQPKQDPPIRRRGLRRSAPSL